jgi:hypothetical protein
MEHDHLDEILSSADDIVPSPGFITNVMAAVREEASAPPPIPFPWKRVVPGLAVGACTFIAFLVATLAPSSGGPIQVAPGVSLALYTIVEAAKAIEAAWIVLALTFVVVSMKFSMRLVGARA